MSAVKKHLDSETEVIYYIVIESSDEIGVALLAGIYAVADSGSYFEIAECLELLKSLQKERPELLRFNVNRWGDLTFIKFTGDVAEAVKR